MGMRCEADENSDWDIYWSDVAVPPEKVNKLWPYQRINYCPNISQLARKNHLAKHLKRMAKDYKDDYNFFPKTW